MRLANRAELLRLVQGERLPEGVSARFSGLLHLTAPCLQASGISWHALFNDPGALATASASVACHAGWGSAVLPLDYCVEAEILGAQIDYQLDAPQPAFPQVRQFAAETLQGLQLSAPENLPSSGRLPLILSALQQLHASAPENERIIGGYLPGPFTLAMQLLPPGVLLEGVMETPAHVEEILQKCAQFLAQIGNLYRNAGADFLTVHEMGGSPGFLGPRPFASLVFPALQELLAKLPTGRVLSICGRTARSWQLLAQSHAEVLSFDQLTPLADARRALPQKLIFGNLDPYLVLGRGTPAEIYTALQQAQADGADAIWPGCDLWLPTPLENLRAFASL